ncbi:ribonuclease HII [Stagnihabitans tardus]|uniref:Ribonuclease HII n=1 Tax=Stagnihabitans tardus TaxID=2699202 RepID=A0AAE4Y7P2_9RHOB|nr:ribonuclease HII [Stagnihabitans tardus]NBZ86679.1 ribonuclease HII [Stagnihabitans tardus]
MDLPDFSFETEARARGFLRIAGVDEVGRGPLAGPVTAAAVILDPDRIPKGLRDSKTISKAALPGIAAAIHASAQVAIAHASVEEIDALNILQAALMAMRRAVDALGADHVLVDGKFIPKGLTGQALVKGDARSLSIAAASIVAKVERDRIMVDLAQQYPGYGWEKNAGYPSPAHKRALLDLGVTPFHRRSFKPVHNILYQEHSASA